MLNLRHRMRLSLFKGLAVAVLLVGAPLLRAAGPAPEVHTVLFFGDSLTEGYGLADPDAESYPAQVQKHIDEEHLPWHVINAGLSGETSAGGLRRIDWVMNQKPDIFVLELGANDGLRGTATDETRANLQGIIDRVRTRSPGTRIVLAGMMMPVSMGQDYADAFRAMFPALAKKNGIVLIPFLLDKVAANPELNQGDGIHPTAAGAKIVADGVWVVLRPVLISGVN
jgi:acyl-CoA thioesterase-1